MRFIYLFSVAASLVLSASELHAKTPTDCYHEGMSLYEKGMFGMARAMFEQAGDPLSQGYAVLCAAMEGDPDYPLLMDKFISANPKSIVNGQLHFQYALILFDEGLFLQAARELDSVDPVLLGSAYLPEYKFKRGYCHYSLDEYADARRCFEDVVSMPHTEYTRPSTYFLGYMEYTAQDFTSAAKWFESSVFDARFEDISKFYLVECSFMQKDYRRVISEGESIMENAPEERKSRLARLISESYMVLGDNSKALEYLKMESDSSEPKTRSDFFHAGSVLYGASDYEGAIANFSAMPDRIDSLGQVANYQLGYSYVKTGKKVLALESFNEAAKYDYNPEIQEDAAFNFAKLSFDLNHDEMGFKAYLAKYSTKSKGEQIYNYMAIAALYNRDYKAAIESYDKLEVLDDVQKGNYVKANYLNGYQLVRTGSWNDAVPYLRAAGFHYPKTSYFNQLSRYWLAESYIHTGNTGEAVKIFTDLYNNSALDGRSEGSLLGYNIAYCYFLLDNMDNASRWFDRYIQSGNSIARKDAMVRRADCDFFSRNYKNAILSYSNVIREYDDDNYIYPYYRQALAYGLNGDKQSKSNTLSRVLKADPSADMWSEALYEYGRSCIDVSDYSTATEAFSKLKTLSRDSTYVARALIGLGMVCRNKADYDKALDNYKAVISMMPGSEYAQDALLAIESIYQTKKQPEMYLAYVEAQKLNVNKTPREKELMYFNTAEQVFLAENWTAAENLLKTYLSNYPDGIKKGEAVFYLAETYKVNGKKEEACAEYEKVPGLLPGNSFAETSRLNSAVLNYGLGRFPKAYVAYKELLDSSKMAAHKELAIAGMMRSAFKSKDYQSAVDASLSVKGVESDFIRAKSLLALSRRDEAMKLFREIAANPSTDEGAESSYILIQDCLDRGDFDSVEQGVYKFSKGAGSQNYWLAKAYILLGDSFDAKGNKAQARATYESIRDGYSPTGAEDDIPDNVKMRLERMQSQN